jgi:hypothetical protein
MMSDFPAAHSMDTDWFAIDADGNIGVFQSGEGGAVPKSNSGLRGHLKIENLEDLFTLMAKDYPYRFVPIKTSSQVLVKSLSLKKLQESIDSWISFSSRNTSYEDSTTCEYSEMKIYDTLLLLSSEDVISQLEIENIDDAFGLHFAGEMRVIFVSHCSIPMLQSLVDEGKVLAGREASIFDFVGLLGFYNYVCGKQSSFPYKLVGKPINPLSLVDIPEQIHELIEGNKFSNLNFNDKKSLQPIEHTECNGYGIWWMDEKGEEHNKHPDY